MNLTLLLFSVLMLSPHTDSTENAFRTGFLPEKTLYVPACPDTPPCRPRPGSGSLEETGSLEKKSPFARETSAMMRRPEDGESASREERRQEENAGINRRFGFWTAYSPVSVPLLATMRNARLALVGVELTHSAVSVGRQRVEFSAEMILMGQAVFPVDGMSGPRDSLLAIGLVPIRLTFPVWYSPGGNHLHLQSGAGFVMFDKPYPNVLGTNLNAIVDFGAGYNFRLSENTSLSVSYRLHHISNGGSGEINPGIDSNLFVFSLNSRI